MSASKYRQVLGENIRAARKAAAWTQENLAEKADLNATYVSDIERGTENVSVDVLMRIARVLKTTVNNLTRGF